MGIFSRSKQLPKSDIPAEILAEVTVNGEKKFTQPLTPVPSVPTVPVQERASTSPFLNASAQNSQESPSIVVPAPVYSEPVKVASPSPHIAGEIRFTDLPEPKRAETRDIEKSPLVERPDFAKITQDQALLARHKEHLSPLKEGIPISSSKERKLLSASNIISFGVFILILTLISGGSWYYLSTRKLAEEQVEPSIDTLVPVEVTGSTPSSEGTILVNQPNYLQIDVETVTREQIQERLQAEFKKMVSENITTPVEYLIVDKNKNLVAFSRFALLVNADSPVDLAEASLEPFSLYLYQDSGALRLALAVILKQEMSGSIQSNKTVYPESLKKFFYPDEISATSLANVQFKQSSYLNNAIFYTNVNESQNYSFDMSLQEGTLTLANSKNTLRAVIDKRRVPTNQ